MDTDQTICTIRPLYEYELETIRPTLKIVANVQLNNEPDMKAAYTGWGFTIWWFWIKCNLRAKFPLTLAYEKTTRTSDIDIGKLFGILQ